MSKTHNQLTVCVGSNRSSQEVLKIQFPCDNSYALRFIYAQLKHLGCSIIWLVQTHSRICQKADDAPPISGARDRFLNLPLTPTMSVGRNHSLYKTTLYPSFSSLKKGRSRSEKPAPSVSRSRRSREKEHLRPSHCPSVHKSQDFL